MSVIIILIVASLFIAVGFLVSYLWAVKSGQYEDDYSSSVRILFDDGPVEKKKNIELNQSDIEMKLNSKS